MHNVKFHKVDDTKKLIKNINYEIKCLPHYSPFLNPIENTFSEHKQIRKLGNPQSKGELMNIISEGTNL